MVIRPIAPEKRIVEMQCVKSGGGLISAPQKSCIIYSTNLAPILYAPSRLDTRVTFNIVKFVADFMKQL